MSNQIKINYTRNDNGVAEPSKHKGAQQAEPNREKTNTSNTNTGAHDGKGTQGEKATVRCSNGDPINMATGAFYYEDSDFILSESSYDFHLIRRYISVKERGSRKSIGWKWTLSVDTCVCRDGETTIVILPDSKEVEFKYDNGVYKNKRGNNKRYTLIRPEEKFIFEDNENNHTYIYDKEGKIETVTDRYGNKTKYEYSDYGIEKVILSTG
ncbi:MAG: hypothetical protein IJF37_03745, partial [Lachnospiraceae bacterium]|nr:hypothetical protein [Lachnospiraceae bacterium]